MEEMRNWWDWRDEMEEVCDSVSASLREKLRSILISLDERYLQATFPVREPLWYEPEGDFGRVPGPWRQRYPRSVLPYVKKHYQDEGLPVEVVETSDL